MHVHHILHYTRPHTNSKKEHILSVWLISMPPSPSYPFVSRMMSPVLIASPSLFQTENMILPVLSATLHFLTVLPSLVFCCVPEKNLFIYININIYLSQLIGLSLPPTHNFMSLLSLFLPTPVYHYKYAVNVFHAGSEVFYRRYSILSRHSRLRARLLKARKGFLHKDKEKERGT